MILFLTKPSPSVANVLRRTLRRLESLPHSQSDPALKALKSRILRALADIEIRKADAA